MQITVIGKANLGWSQKFGEIAEGQEYQILPEDFTEQLFTHPEPPADVHAPAE